METLFTVNYCDFQTFSTLSNKQPWPSHPCLFCQNEMLCCTFKGKKTKKTRNNFLDLNIVLEVYVKLCQQNYIEYAIL